MVRTVADAALTMQSIAGPDPDDDAEYAAIFGPDYLDHRRHPAAAGHRARLHVGARPELRPGQAHRLQRHAHARQRAEDRLRRARRRRRDHGAAAADDRRLDAGPCRAATSSTRRSTSTTSGSAPACRSSTLVEEVAANHAEAHAGAEVRQQQPPQRAARDITPGGANETHVPDEYDAAQNRLAQGDRRHAEQQTPADPSDDFIAILGSAPSSPQAGYPQITIPMGYNTTTRRTVNVSVNGGPYKERDLIGIALRDRAGDATCASRRAWSIPSMYRCAHTVPAAAVRRARPLQPGLRRDHGDARRDAGAPAVLARDRVGAEPRRRG